jgi:hypothetical protein
MKSLITITTCSRLKEVKKYIWAYISFCNKNTAFHFLLALDGTDQSYFDFCNQYCIPILFSDEREGVGLTKNRVLSRFPDYDYYFFIDDDAELMNSEIFENMITLSKKEGYHHMSITTLKKVFIKEQKEGITICKGFYGGGYFNFYTKPGLEKVGGWHTLFAHYKRYGHTEHSYRYMYSSLAEYPFIVPYSFLSDILLHDPPHVTKIEIDENANEMIPEEQEMIDRKQAYFALTTLSTFHYNQVPFGFNAIVENLLKHNSSRYPLLKGREKMLAISDYYFHKFTYCNQIIEKFGYFSAAFFLNPVNQRIKHRIKQMLGLVK